MKKITLFIALVLSLSIFANENEANMWEKIKLDYKNYYVLGDYKEEIGRASCRERVSSPV